MAVLNEKQAKKITDTCLGAAMVPELVVRVRERVAGNTRFARNEPTTEGDVETLEISVTASIQGRTASASGNRSDKASLEALVAEAEELAALSPENPEHVAPVGKGAYLKVAGHDKAAAKLDAKGRAKLVEQSIGVAKAADLELAGFASHYEESLTVATSAGGFAHHLHTNVELTTTCRTRDAQGSGWAGSESHTAAGIDALACTQLAAEKAEISSEAEALDPGKYLVILEPQAVAELLSFLVDSLDARAADEGRSWFSRPDGGSRVGEELFHTSVTLRSNPADPDHPAAPFADDGQAHKIIEWVGDGVLQNLTRTRYWAEQSKEPAVPRPSSVFLDGQELELLELVQAVDQAVLVTRFWYNRMLDPRSLLVTGLTRDGTFLVKGGKITTAIKNFRYNDSPVTMLRNVLAMGRPQRVVTRGGRVMVVPPLVVREFNFASSSDAI